MKYGISSLMDSSVRVCTAIQHSVLAGTTEVKLFSRQHFVQHSGTLMFPRRQRQSTLIHNCCCSRIHARLFNAVDEDSRAIDSFPASSQFVAVPCSTGYLNVNTPRLFLDAMMPGVLGLLSVDAV